MEQTTKQDVLKLIEQLPDDASLEDMMYELYFRQRIERGLKDSAEGRTIPHEEVMRRISEWFHSAGPKAQSGTSGR